jgi:hypothetical protein
MSQPPPLTLRVKKLVTSFYTESRDFNGILYDELLRRMQLPEASVRRAVRMLIRRGAISAIFGDFHPNANIRALPDEPIASQLTKFVQGSYVCLYPTEATLAVAISKDAYFDRPFTRRLALGEPQLLYSAFDPAVLELYRNDPRYVFQLDDAGGMISISDEYYKSRGMPERDQVLLKTFGFCYGPKKRRAVGVFLRYLSDLTPEHQRIWQARTLQGAYKMHPDYWDSAMGNFPKGASIFDAVLAEITFINRMAIAMGRGPLFKDDFRERRPIEYTFLLRPTKKAFDAFVQALDKVLSENIEIAFFCGDVEREVRQSRKNDEVVATSKGTISMLKEWVNEHFRSEDPSVSDLFATLQHVRKLRSKPAHEVQADAFDEALFETQRDLIIRVYKAVQTLRLILGFCQKRRTVKFREYCAGKQKSGRCKPVTG